MAKLGLIAGGGDLPVLLATHCRAVGRPVFVVRLAGFASPRLGDFEGVEAGLGELRKGINALRGAGCEAVCFAGKVERPDLRHLKSDLRGLRLLPAVIAATRRGDDHLLTLVLREFESEGFAIEGAHQVMESLALGAGSLGSQTPSPADMEDIQCALQAARAIGLLDIGQAAVSCAGLILALEAQEGTDCLLTRVASLPRALRGAPDERRGVLAKACKPGQETRIDLPTIGPTTVRLAGEAGLAGIAGETGRLLVVEREETVALAERLGLFIFGAPTS